METGAVAAGADPAEAGLESGRGVWEGAEDIIGLDRRMRKKGADVGGSGDVER